MTKPDAEMDPMTDEWDYGITEHKYSNFAKLMHKLEMAIHPWPLQDDHLLYNKGKGGYVETSMYIK